MVAEPVVAGVVVPRGWPMRMPSPFWSPLKGLFWMLMTAALDRFKEAPSITAMPVSMLWPLPRPEPETVRPEIVTAPPVIWTRFNWL